MKGSEMKRRHRTPFRLEDEMKSCQNPQGRSPLKYNCKSWSYDRRPNSRPRLFPI